MYPEIITEYTDDLSNHFREWAKTEDLDPDKFCTILSYELSKRVFPKWIKDSSDFLLEEEEILDAMNFSYIVLITKMVKLFGSRLRRRNHLTKMTLIYD